MVFNSLAFIIFFLLFFWVYWKINDRYSVKARNIFILLASYLFYGWWDWRFLGLLVASSLTDYFIGNAIYVSEKEGRRKMLLVFSLLVNFGILGFFKYCNFFVESMLQLFSVFSIHPQISTLKIILPVGISFYTFQSISYIIDIYRKQLTPAKEPLVFMTYVAFFPQLVAGPIERAARMLPQFVEKKKFNREISVAGLRLVLWGFFKQVVIADNFGLLGDTIFDPNNHYSSATTLFGIFLFSFQIYCDFSGYSDIARGVARLLGFELMSNFKVPYFSDSFKEFWHRWHIALSTWFRDYVYLPLGGNKGSKLRIHANIFITFLLSGLWHGPKVTFLIWGSFHGLALIAENIFRKRDAKASIFYTLFVFVAVCLLWLPFRANSTEHFNALLHQIGQFDISKSEIVYLFSAIIMPVKAVFLFVIFFLFLFVERKIGTSDFNIYVSGLGKVARYSFYYILFFLILLMGNYNVKPYFIYFQF